MVCAPANVLSGELMFSVRALFSLLLLLIVAACATPFRSDVARFHAIQSIAPGSTFSIEAADPEKRDSLEFQTYAARVAQALDARGMRQAPRGIAGDYQLMVDYGVDQGREKIDSRPGFGPSYAYGFGYSRYGYGYPFRYYGAYGWYDPFWSAWGPGSFYGPEIYSYTQYGSFLAIQMKSRDGSVVFEGRAESETRTRDLTKLVPLLVQAMFTDFPGQSGQTVTVSIDDKGRATTRVSRG